MILNVLSNASSDVGVWTGVPSSKLFPNKVSALEHGSDLGVHDLKDLAATFQELIPVEQEQGWSFLASFLNSCNQLVLLGSTINLKMSSFCTHQLPASCRITVTTLFKLRSR